jgi:pimeloyl-ACP methyl ester carboxylesterase
MSRWILLRGLTREAAHWGDFTDRMRAAFPNEDIRTPDLPGNGRLNTLQSPLRIAAMTDHCRCSLAQEGFNPPYRVLAMSMGAMVAVDWAARYPGEIERLVLINTSLRGVSPFYRRLRAGRYPAIARQLISNRTPLDREKFILSLTSAHPSQHPDLPVTWARIRESRPVSTANALRQLMAAARFHLPPQKPVCPILLLASRHDRLVDPRCSRDLAHRWRCQLRWHEAAGHDLPLDDGVWVANQIQHWIAQT